MSPSFESIERWFADRNWLPFPYQYDTWRAYRAGESGLVHAPTGTGKTYAVWMGPLTDPAPISPNATVPFRVLWITPLRALAQDTLKALELPIHELHLPWTVELRTGDTTSAVRQRQRQKLPSALITTPENISLLLSYPETQTNFATLDAVIVDEWHELLGTKRGVQVELALARLRMWRPQLRIWGLSATIGNLPQACEVLLGGRPGRLIDAPHTKEIEVETKLPATVEHFPWAGHLGFSLLPAVLKAVQEAQTTLVFTNTRSQAELWFRALLAADASFAGALGLHHGSLDRKIRRQVESLTQAGKMKAVVCTSSLDLGVDFTVVDQVIQIGGPKGVGRLLQRAGRSGHQPGETSRVLCVPTHALELMEFAAARDAIVLRAIEARTPLERPLDALVQHLVTIALGSGFDEAALYDEVRSTYAYRALTRDEWKWTLDFVVHGGSTLQAYPEYAKVTPTDGVYRVLVPRIARLHRMSIGTIASDGALHVQFLRGRRLGSIEENFISRLKPGDRFLFAGRTLELIRVREMTAYVRAAAAGKPVVAQWLGGRMPLSNELGKAVRVKLEEAHHHTYASPEMAALEPLLELHRRWSALPKENQLLVERLTLREGTHHFIYPFEGRWVHEGLAALWGHRLARRQPLTLTFGLNDYGLALVSPQPLALSEEDWQMLLSTDSLLDDLLACVNSSELARRRFREIARVAGLVFQGYPGRSKTTRQIQASSGLFYDVFVKYDADNLLLAQARREVLEAQLEFRRLKRTLERLAEMERLEVATRRLSPLAFPLWAERIQGQTISSERTGDRIRRMAAQLEEEAALPAMAAR